jgi:ribosome-associated toxin RatA of RatAB toxin-antitoxin module
MTGIFMPHINRSALVPYSAEQMFALVNDIHAYPEFIPGCTGSRVVGKKGNELIAEMDVSKAGIKKTFTTRNVITDNESIVMAVSLIFRWLAVYHFKPGSQQG